MKRVPVVLFILIVIAMAAGSGCTQAPPPEAEPDTLTSPISDLALTSGDTPANFTLVDSRPKTADEVGSLAKDLGWQKGYVVTYTGMPDHRMGPTEITQTIAIYPEERIPEIVAFADTNDRADPELIITVLPPPLPGENSHAFSGKAGSQIVLRPDSGAPLDSGSLKGSFKQDMVEIIFARGSTLEVLRMTGPYADYATLSVLAQKAYAKLP